MANSDPTAPVVARSDAQRRCQQIHLLLESMSRQKEKILALVTEAKDRDDHLALGYPSWPAYVAAEFAAALSDLTRDDRRWTAFALSQTGMSSRAIAPIIGVSARQAAYDVAVEQGVHTCAVDQVCNWCTPADPQVNPGFAQVGSHFPPDPEAGDPAGQDPLDEALAAISKITSTKPTKDVVGMDGKTYVRPVAARGKVRRTPLPDQYRDAVYDLRKAVRRLERLTADGRFSGNRDAIAARHRGELATYSKTLWQARAALNEGGPE